MEIRRCKVCGIEKELNPENFCFSTKGICKNKSTCRQCIILKHREYNTKNRVIINAKKREYDKTPKVQERKREYRKKYKAEHREEIIKREKARRATDELFRFKSYARCIIKYCFRYSNAEKCKRTKELTKLRVDNLKQYLLKTFKNRYGYEWDGKEKVEIDHIKPLILAKTKQEVIELCCYENLQLLKKEDNSRKAYSVGSWS